MSEQSQGLRFDVYERVHLPEEVPAIEELEEIELVPRIQVVQQGEQAILRGQLLLSGVYRTSDRSLSAQSMEHQIPVEITLPMSRIERLDDISVEIDNFDVDLLSVRTLNITGVLSLSGIRVEDTREEEGEWKEEPYTVIHRQDPQGTGDISPPRYLELAEEEAEEVAAVESGSSEPEDEAVFSHEGEAAAYRNYDPVEEAQNQPYTYAAGWTQLTAPRAADAESGSENPTEAVLPQNQQGWSRIENQQAELPVAYTPSFPASPAPLQAPVNREEQQSAFFALKSITGETSGAEPQSVSAAIQSELEEEEDPAAVLYGRPSAELPPFEAERPFQSLQQEPQFTSPPELRQQLSAEPLREPAAPVAPAESLRESAVPVAPAESLRESAVPVAPAESLRESAAPVAPAEPVRESAALASPPVPAEPQAASLPVQAEPTSGGEYVSPFVAEAQELPEPQPEQERQELRIAFGSKRPAAATGSGQELASMLGSSRRDREQRQAAERSRQAQESQASLPSEDLEWQSLFLGRANEEKAFRRVRLCIVQREETLELIADRYQLQPREIALYNRLSDQGVAEGQVLYIP